MSGKTHGSDPHFHAAGNYRLKIFILAFTCRLYFCSVPLREEEELIKRLYYYITA